MSSFTCIFFNPFLKESSFEGSFFGFLFFAVFWVLCLFFWPYETKKTTPKVGLWDFQVFASSWLSESWTQISLPETGEKPACEGCFKSLASEENASLLPYEEINLHDRNTSYIVIFYTEIFTKKRRNAYDSFQKTGKKNSSCSSSSQWRGRPQHGTKDPSIPPQSPQ